MSEDKKNTFNQGIDKGKEIIDSGIEFGKEISKGVSKAGKDFVNAGKELGKDIVIKGQQLMKNISPQFADNFEKHANRTIRDVFRDIEIRKPQFIVLYIIMISLGCIIALNIKLGMTFITSIQLFGISYIVIGFLAGLIAAAITADKFERRYPLIIITLLFSGFSIIFELIFAQNSELELIKALIVFLNALILGATSVFMIVLCIEYTSALERGRVFALLLMSAGTTCLPIIVVAYFGDTFLFLPSLIPIIGGIYLFKRRELEAYKALTVKKSDQVRKQKLDNLETVKNRSKIKFPLLVNKQYVKNLFFMITFGLISGLSIPLEQFQETLNNELFQSYFFLSLIFILIVLNLAVLIIGITFDLFGRRTVLSIFILAMGIVTFIREFVSIDFQNIAMSIALIIGVIQLIPLTVGELTEPIYFGRASAIGMLVTITGISLGLTTQFLIESLWGVRVVTSLICIISLFFLVHVNEGIPRTELNWPDSLVHMYIVHDSGMLIYEYDFQNEQLMESDLISGGIIGLVTMLKEITRGKGNLRAIDHGDKKIMFIWSGVGDVIFVLLAKYELIVLRNKLQDFADEFEEIYAPNIKKISGICPDDWKATKYLVQKYFMRKNIVEDIMKDIAKSQDEFEFGQN
jgi:MFS family permease